MTQWGNVQLNWTKLFQRKKVQMAKKHMVGMWASTTTMENSMEALEKTKHRCAIQSNNPTLRDIPKGMWVICYKGTCTLMFIAALFTIAKLWKQLRCKCGIYIQWKFTQPQRRMKFCHSQVNGRNWRTSS
jgi:hypothetical protein